VAAGNLSSVRLDGQGMCGDCINGCHRKPGETVSAVILPGQKTLCNCPCHLPKSAFSPPGRRPRPAKPEQLTILAETEPLKSHGKK